MNATCGRAIVAKETAHWRARALDRELALVGIDGCVRFVGGGWVLIVPCGERNRAEKVVEALRKTWALNRAAMGKE